MGLKNRFNEKETEKKRAKKQKHASKRHLFPTKPAYKIALIVISLIGVVFMCMMILVDAFPTDLALSLIVIMFAMLIVSCILFASNRKSIRALGILIALLYSATFSVAIGFMGNTYAMLNKISDTGIKATGPQADSVDVTEEPFNVYLTGIDQWAKEKGLDLERSDVNMLATINPTTHTVLLTSIPRDTYVKLHTAQQMDKLTHTGIYGVDETINTVEDWLGIDINYYVKMNFTGARDIIDAMGGIDVYSPVEFRSSLKGYRYKKGWNHLPGKRAIYFARERKSFEGQDVIRVENQQRVIKAAIKKMTSSTTLLTRYGAVMDAAGDNMQTNLSSAEMRKLVKMQIAELPEWKVETQKIDGEVDQDYVASLSQKYRYDIFRPSEESVKSCIDKINEVRAPAEEDISSLRDKNRSFFINAVRRLTAENEGEAQEE